LNATGSLGRRSAVWIRHASFILMEKKRNEDKGVGIGGLCRAAVQTTEVWRGADQDCTLSEGNVLKFLDNSKYIQLTVTLCAKTKVKVILVSERHAF
jgi:hypothetical protein